METRDLLVDAFGRIVEDFEAAVDGLTAAQVRFRPDAEANSIAWLVWHATRVQDDHVADLAGDEQVWITDGFEAGLGLDLDPRDIGYGHNADDVSKVEVHDPTVLLDYLRAVTERTYEYLLRVDEAELDRIVDRRWDPPVTAGVRLVSVIDDGMQHAGQARYVRGLLERRQQP